MTPQELVNELKASHEFFNRSTRALVEADSSFSPSPGTLSAAQQVAHCAGTIDWFVEGAFSPTGFDVDFETQAKKYMAVTSITKAREWFERSIATAMETIGSKSPGELTALIPAGTLMGGATRWSALLGIIEHTAHHRGALTVYARLLGKVPPMPYMDM